MIPRDTKKLGASSSYLYLLAARAQQPNKLKQKNSLARRRLNYHTSIERNAALGGASSIVLHFLAVRGRSVPFGGSVPTASFLLTRNGFIEEHPSGCSKCTSSFNGARGLLRSRNPVYHGVQHLPNKTPESSLRRNAYKEKSEKKLVNFGFVPFLCPKFKNKPEMHTDHFF